jgi:peptide/nickel transport system substrate-binding protein
MTKLAGAILASCLGFSAATGMAAGLRIGLQGDPDVLDPAIGGSFLDRVVFAGLCDKLIDIDRNLNYVPQLATEWSWSTDALALTLKLRGDVEFHDGTKMDAAAVKANVERGKTLPESRRKAELAPIADVEVVDARTVRMRLTQPFAPLVGALTDRAGMVASPKAFLELGAKFSTSPVCSGPYRFVERVAQDRIVLRKFDRHWDAAAYPLDSVTYLPIPDSTVRLANLRSGGLDMIERVAPTDLPEARADRRVKLVESPSIGYYTMSFNVANGERASTPFGRDPRVREAFESSIDRAAINQVVFNGEFIPSNQPHAPGHPYYVDEFPVPKRDLAKAKALLKAAGQDRVAVTLYVPTSTAEQQVGQVIQTMAGEAGFDVKLEIIEGTTMVQRSLKGDYQASINIWSGRPDPDANISIWLACNGFVNFGKYCNAKLDEILGKAKSITDAAARKALYRDAAAIYLDERPHLFLYHLKWFWGLSARLQGFEPVPDGVIRLRHMRL